MFCFRTMNRRITYIHERVLRLFYGDYNTSFSDLLLKDNSVTIHFRNIGRPVIEMFKIENNLCPEFIKELFNIVPCQTRSKALFHRQNINKVYKSKCSLRSFGPIVRNAMVRENLKTTLKSNIIYFNFTFISLTQ